MRRLFFINLLLVGSVINSMSSDKPASPVAEKPEEHFYVCAATLGTAHFDCFVSQRLSQKCLCCRHFDMLPISKTAALVAGVDFGKQCLLCNKLLNS